MDLCVETVATSHECSLLSCRSNTNIVTRIALGKFSVYCNNATHNKTRSTTYASSVFTVKDVITSNSDTVSGRSLLYSQWFGSKHKRVYHSITN